jgi:hypothetical protein
VVNPDLTPKPACLAIQTLTRELAGCRLDRRLDTGNTNDFVLLFRRNGGEVKLAAWRSAGSSQVALPVKNQSDDELPFINGSGQRGKLAIQGGQLVLPLDDTPKYVALKDSGI